MIIIKHCKICRKELSKYQKIYCSPKCSANDPVVRKKTKQTMLERYGADNPMRSEEIKNKIRQTCFKKYGAFVATKNKNVKEKIKQTNLERYGFACSLQNEKILKKAKKTLKQNYNVDNPSKSRVIRERKEQTSIITYGAKYPMQNEQYKKNFTQKIISKYGCRNVSQFEQVKQKKEVTTYNNYNVKNPSQSELIKERKKSTCLKNYGVIHHMKHEKTKRRILGKVFGSQNKKFVSKIQNRVFKELKNHCAVLADNKSIHIPNKKKFYNCDIVFKEKMKIIEIFGDYWHCNPKTYKSDYYNGSIGKTAKEIWEYDEQKIINLESKGWQVLILWEKDINKDFDKIIKEAKKFLSSPHQGHTQPMFS